MNTSLIQLALLILFGATYLPIAFFAMQRREDGHGAALRLLTVYALLALVAQIVEAVWRNGENADLAALREFEIYAAATLIVAAALILQAFLKQNTWKPWVGGWAGWALILALLLTNALNLPETVRAGGAELLRERLAPAWGILGWLIFFLCLIAALVNENKEARQALFRNRVNYWRVALALIFLNDALIFSGTLIPGQPLRLLAAALIAYVVGTHHVPDLRELTRYAAAYLLAGLIGAGLYAALMPLTQALAPQARANPLPFGAFIAAAVGLCLAPLSKAFARAANARAASDHYDVSRTIHQYSESISNILEMDKLANVAVGIILEAMQIERGFLFLVDTERADDGRKLYVLRLARSPEERQMVAAQLDENGTVAAHFLREQRPLLQYDLELLPAFKNAAPAEREWFQRLQAEAYIPIFAKRQWIGLLAFGHKLSGNRYSTADLLTLSAHANQTAVALENARLVENLMKVNAELQQARRALENNNRDLERIDQAKSDFISIASHELRTPLTVIKGYSEMLTESPNLDANFKFMLDKIHEGTVRLYEVMESMFDIAQIDARALKPHIQPVEIGVMLKEICFEHADIVKDRKQSLTMEIPPLPHVKADNNLLRKVFHHLMRNAIKYTDNGGKLGIAAQAVAPSADLPHGGVEIVFSDTGVGVDPNFREIIFTKFYQPGELGKHSTSKTRFKGGGAGLGLALSKGIIEAHGGRIWVESPGYDEVNFPGSQFHVILPLPPLEAGEKHKISEAATFKV